MLEALPGPGRPEKLRSPLRPASAASAEPTPQRPVRSAEWVALGCSFVSGYPRRPRPPQGRASGDPQSAHFHLPRAPGVRKGSDRAAGFLPRPASEVSLLRGAAPVWGPQSSSRGTVCGQVQALAQRMPCRGGGVLLLRESRRSGESKDLRAEKPAGGGGVPWAPRPQRLSGKFSWLH